MISAQIDELRQMADGQATYRDAREVMLHAADTICELRGALQVASVDYRHLAAENAKLRERIHELEMEGSDHFYRTAYAEDANRTLESENAELRELAADAWCYISHPADASWTHVKRKEVRDGIGDRMRELGVEVLS